MENPLGFKETKFIVQRKYDFGWGYYVFESYSIIECKKMINLYEKDLPEFLNKHRILKKQFLQLMTI